MVYRMGMCKCQPLFFYLCEHTRDCILIEAAGSMGIRNLHAILVRMRSEFGLIRKEGLRAGSMRKSTVRYRLMSRRRLKFEI